VAGIPVVPAPDVRVVVDALADDLAGSIGVDPAAQGRPGVQQRLMGDLDAVSVDGDEPGVGLRRTATAPATARTPRVTAVPTARMASSWFTAADTDRRFAARTT
jgi:hypothetical protein